MAAPEVMTLEGGRELEAALKELDGRVARKLASKGLRAGAKVIQKPAQAAWPKKSGASARAIKIRAGKNRKNRRSIVVSIGEKWFAGDQFYAAFLEFGHRQGSRKLGDARQEIEGRHIMEKTFESHKQQAVTVVINTTRKLIDEEAEKIGRTIGKAGAR